MFESAFLWLSFAIFLYFVFYAATTFGLISRSLYETVLTGLERGREFTPPQRTYRPGISLIAPAYNMAPVIAASARALLLEGFVMGLWDAASEPDAICEAARAALRRVV